MQITKHIPNAITSMNLLSGSIGVIFTMQGRLDIAFLLMLAAAAFDFLDGMSARLLGKYSDIGKELDSLSDLVSFGLLPSLMLFKSLEGQPVYLQYIPLAIVVFSALRLAKFNIDERQHENFIGLPTPACAMICGSLSYYIFISEAGVEMATIDVWLIAIMSVILSALLVSEIPMFGMKFGKNIKTDAHTKIMRIGFVSIIVPVFIGVLLLGENWSLAIFSLFCIYILMNVVSCFIRR